MKKFLVMPDSFKGTMDATEVSDIMADALLSRYPEAEVVKIPMADGGEGSCECFHASMGGELVETTVTGPYFGPDGKKKSCYWRKGELAVVELAQAAGFITDEKLRNPAATTTFGVGELIMHAIKSGCKKIILAIGGSCTNDCGAGMAGAMGARFYEGDNSFVYFYPTGWDLCRVSSIDISELKKHIEGVEFDVMCDVDNPLFGENGAAYVFAPQKGADEEMVRMLDYNLEAFAWLLERRLGLIDTEKLREEYGVDSIRFLPGGGAAGGVGAGAYAFLGAKLRNGADIVLDMNDIDEKLEDCDMVFTGEGSLDSQTLQGKVIMSIAERAKAKGVPVTAVVGAAKGNYSKLRDCGVVKVVQTIDFCKDRENYQKTCREDLKAAMEAALDDDG